MSTESATYEPKYLAGILLFNAGDYFEAHEVWEDLWHETVGPERSFYQGLIQVAVGLCHFGNGNHRGALKLHQSSLDYLKRFQPECQGLNLEQFTEALDRCYAPLLNHPSLQASNLNVELVPQIVLNPQPAQWPNVADFLPDEALE